MLNPDGRFSCLLQLIRVHWVVQMLVRNHVALLQSHLIASFCRSYDIPICFLSPQSSASPPRGRREQRLHNGHVGTITHCTRAETSRYTTDAHKWCILESDACELHCRWTSRKFAEAIAKCRKTDNNFQNGSHGDNTDIVMRLNPYVYQSNS